MNTSISKLGQFAFIDKITEKFPLNQGCSILGVGDDAAIIAPEKGFDIVVSTESILEGIHFDLAYTPLRHLGYKAVIIAIADIYAMGGIPTHITVSIGITSRFFVEDIEEIYEGIRLATQKYNVDLIGGDTSASVTGLILNITAIGKCIKDKHISRSNAKPTDLICITGDLGAAYMGLQLLERERGVFVGEKGDDIQPDFAGKEYIIERQLKPELPLNVLSQLAEKGIIPTAMIDVSDGLASELLQISKSSNVGIRLYEDKIPIDFVTANMAEEMNLNLTTVALNGGEDYEMLMTIPLGLLDKAREIDNLRIIGHITEPSLGAYLVTRDGNEIQLQAQGFTKKEN